MGGQCCMYVGLKVHLSLSCQGDERCLAMLLKTAEDFWVLES